MAPRPLFAVVLAMMLDAAAGKHSMADSHAGPTSAGQPQTNCPLEGRGGDPGLNISHPTVGRLCESAA
jgi:hypothetical protein